MFSATGAMRAQSKWSAADVVAAVNIVIPIIMLTWAHRSDVESERSSS